MEAHRQSPNLKKAGWENSSQSWNPQGRDQEGGHVILKTSTALNKNKHLSLTCNIADAS